MKRKAGAVACAALAWILWTQYTSKHGKGWQAEKSFKTENLCILEQDQLIFLALKDEKTLRQTAGGVPGYRTTDKDGTFSRVFFHCFPQDFDPRPRK